MRIAFLGLGSMGRPMAANLAESDHELVVWNRTRSKAEGLEGVEVADTPAGAARDAAVVLTMLSDDDAVEAVVLGEDGALDGMEEDAAHASMSTISADMSRRLAAAHGERSQRYVAAPVFGRPEMAEEAALVVLAGGSAEAVDACRPAFEVVGSRVVEVGEAPEAANVVKLAGNFMLASAIEAMAEAYTLVGAHGVPTDLFHGLVAGGLFRSPIYENYGSMVQAARYEPAGFALVHGLKDVRFALRAAEEASVPMPFASVLRDRLLSATARGWGDADWAALGKVAAADAGRAGTEGGGEHG